MPVALRAMLHCRFMDECLLYAEPELYDMLFPSPVQGHRVEDEARRERILASERFYLEEARRSAGRVLEMACGAGRLTVPIAQMGIEIMGADLSPTMLEAARVKAAAAGVLVPLVQADMRNFDLPGKFSTILIAGNSLLHLLTVDDLRQCLASVRRHLSPRGRVVFDVSNPNVRLLAREAGPRYPLFRVNDPQRGEVGLEETVSYDAAAQVSHIRWYLSAPGAPDFRVIDYSLRVIFPEELLLLLEGAGFKLNERYGEFSRVPFESSSPRQVCIATTLS
jgi:SAM-dependent methyltransferase